jgi:lipopolysaccharide biosynthesis protein
MTNLDIPDIVIVIHIYYLDMLDDLVIHITKLREVIEFDILVTTPHADSVELIRNKLGADSVLITENKGRDVLPFLKVLPLIKKYKYACKLHTKNRKECAWDTPAKRSCINWRDLMWNTLLDPDHVVEYLNTLKYGSGVFAPDKLWLNNAHSDKLWLNKAHPEVFVDNIDNMSVLSDIVGIKLQQIDFIAGTMFWFKPSSLVWLSDYDFDILFESECGAYDGKMEHAFERSFSQLAKVTHSLPIGIKDGV